MRTFWLFKAAFYAFMKLFIKAIPFICLVALIFLCWNCIKNKHITFLEIVLIGLYFSGVILFSYDYFSRIFNSHKKAEEITFNIICHIGIFCALCLLIYGYINVINVYSVDFPYLINALIVLTILSFFLYVLKNKFLPYLTPVTLIVYRITLLAFITITSLLYTLLSIKNCFTDASIYNYCSLSTALLSLWIVYLEFYHNFAYITYKRSKYILFLRNFSMDDRILEANLLSEVEFVCNKLKLFLMRIGNPRKMFDYSPGKTLYLKTINWKEPVEQYIKDAQVVFTVVSHSDGLFWEILNHTQYSSKFLYNILDIAKMRDDLGNGKYDRIKHTKFGGILYFVCSAYKGPFGFSEDSGTFGITFTFNKQQLIISSFVVPIIEHMLEPDSVVATEDIQVIKLEYNEDTDKIFICYDGEKFLINNTSYHD